MYLNTMLRIATQRFCKNNLEAAVKYFWYNPIHAEQFTKADARSQTKAMKSILSVEQLNINRYAKPPDAKQLDNEFLCSLSLIFYIEFAS